MTSSGVTDTGLLRRQLLAGLGGLGGVGIEGAAVDGSRAVSRATFYVGTDGDDDNPGSEADPLATISEGLDRATPGDTVAVLPGTYYQTVWVNDDRAGEPGEPITLTGPPDAVLKPEQIEYNALFVAASHFRLTGLTIDGLLDEANPEDYESYAEPQLISVGPQEPDPEDPDYLSDLVLSPHRMGNCQSAFINVALLTDSEIGGFEVIGPAGTYWLLRNEPGEPLPDGVTTGHNGEIVYLGTAPTNLKPNKGLEVYDRTRNIRVHHIDNSAGHGHSQLVDCKAGTENVTIEYCTDAWGSLHGYESDRTRTIACEGHDHTIRWNVLRGTRGDAIEITRTFVGDEPGEAKNTAEPATELEDRMGTDNEVYGNVISQYTFKTIRFTQLHTMDPALNRSEPHKQGSICANTIDGPTDGAPASGCDADLPAGDGIGHLGGDSPWRADGEPGDIEAVREAMGEAEFQVNPTVETGTIGVAENLTVTVDVENTGDVRGRKRLRCTVGDGGVIADETQLTLDDGESTTVTLAAQPIFGWTIPEGVDGAEVPVSINGARAGDLTVDSGFHIDPTIRETRIPAVDTLYVDVDVSHTGDQAGEIRLPLMDPSYHGDEHLDLGISTVDPDVEVTTTLERSLLFAGKQPLALFGHEFGYVVVDPPITAYTNERGVVDTRGLRDAVGDWQTDDIDSTLLRNVIDSWAAGEPVE